MASSGTARCWRTRGTSPTTRRCSRHCPRFRDPLTATLRCVYTEPMNNCSHVHLSPNAVVSLKARLLAPATVDALAETFKILGDSTRVRILDALARSELCVCDLARLLGLSESAASHQLRVLRGMRLVRPRRD